MVFPVAPAVRQVNLHKWFSMIDLDEPQAWHFPLFFRYLGLMPNIQTQADYDLFFEQVFDAEVQSFDNDHANIWFHCLLFVVMVYEITHQIPGGMCDLYSEKFDVFRPEVEPPKEPGLPSLEKLLDLSTRLTATEA